MRVLILSCLVFPWIYANGANEDATSTRLQRTEKGNRQSDHGARAYLSASGTTFMQEVKVEAPRAKSLAQTEGKKISKARNRGSAGNDVVASGVTWNKCVGGFCSCHAGIGRETVIRYRQASPGHPRERAYENSYYRFVGFLVENEGQGDDSFTHTPAQNFSVGFKNDEGEWNATGHRIGWPGIKPYNPAKPRINVTNLHVCGGTISESEDCGYEPQPCTFDDIDNNPHDAKAGEFCCSPDFKYCSYKCVGDEQFKCPESTTDQNFLAGMDPVGDDIEKACFSADYVTGTMPEYGSDDDFN